MMTTTLTKRLFILRHGQALHNPRAEAAKAAGCSHKTFMDLMHQDDAFDAPLTSLGEAQANECRMKYRKHLETVELVVSSPLSRALKTADLVVEPPGFGRRVVVEDFREINGWLVNAKRRDRSDLENRFHPSWDFSLLTHKDETWTETMESESSCAERGYQGLIWLTYQKEENILLVGHGGLLRFLMTQHPEVQLSDERKENNTRFGNCELREFVMSWEHDDDMNLVNGEVKKHRPVITLKEVMRFVQDLENEESVSAAAVV